MDNSSKYWGYHLMLDCSSCNFNKITDPTHIKNFLAKLIPSIGMTAFGEPMIEMLLAGDENEGYSVLQLITTSNITAHFVNRNCSAYIDVFSCKKFEIDLVLEITKEFFEYQSIKHQFIIRNAD
jgi:S-adenosylmethionine decarboxylase